MTSGAVVAHYEAPHERSKKAVRPHATHSVVNRPENSKWSQQNLRKWEPMLTLGWAMGISWILAVSCVALGSIVLIKSKSLDTYRVVYDGGDYDNWANRGEAQREQRDGSVDGMENCLLDTAEMANSFHGNHTCFIHLTLRKPIHQAAYIYYEVSGFFQNHRRFVSSVHRTQFTDEWRPSTPITTCAPMINVTSELCTAGSCDPSTTKQRKLFPCGIVANTMFNDIFWLHDGTLPNGEKLGRTDLVSHGAAREYLSYKYKNPSWPLSTDEYLPIWHNPNLSRIIPPVHGDQRPYVTRDYTNSTAWVVDPTDPELGVGVGLENEHWRVWVEIAAQQPFRKAYGRIPRDLPAGTKLTFAVQSNFFVRSFGGSKALVVARLSWFGSENYPLGVFFVAVGVVFGIAGVYFAILRCRNPRTLGDASALVWKHRYREKQQ